jgi:hypothetical protein
MAINANNIIIQDKVVKTLPRKQRPPQRRAYEKDETILVVDGKEKKISRKSKYLIDLLTIEENDK